MQSRGQTHDERHLPRAFYWIESNSIESIAKPDPDDDPASGTDQHTISFQVGVIAKDYTALDIMDQALAKIRERMWVPFEGHQIRLERVDYEEEIRNARPFVSGVLNFTLVRLSPTHDVE